MFHDQNMLIGQFWPNFWKVQQWHRELVFNLFGFRLKQLSTLNFVSQIKLSKCIILDVLKQTHWIAHFSKSRIQKQSNSEPSAHSSDIFAERFLKIRLDDFHHHLTSVFEDTAVHLSDACCCKGFFFEGLKGIKETSRSSTANQ